MGIFDDAIREHLDLKRRHGADESEVQQLEDEAFGLPARPGDPDFPETGQEQQAPAADDAVAPPVEAYGGPRKEAPAEVPDEPDEPAPAEAPEPEPDDQAPPHGDALLAREEPPAPPADAPVEDSDAPGLSTAEREAIAAEPTEFFDQAPDPLDLGELDLELDEEPGDVAAPDEPATDAEPAAEESAEESSPVEALEGVEGEEPAESGPVVEDGDDEPEAEDVLEETPEFLRDNPDDDELWFEQGQPKDFDF